jgi:hypothetical protein
MARVPNAPALQTAATRFGSVIQFIPAIIIGCWIPKISVILVFNISPSSESRNSPFDAYPILQGSRFP